MVDVSATPTAIVELPGGGGLSFQTLLTVGVVIFVLAVLIGFLWFIWAAIKQGKLNFPFFEQFPVKALIERRRVTGRYHSDFTALRKTNVEAGLASFKLKNGQKFGATSYDALFPTAPDAFVALEEYERDQFHPIRMRHLDQYSAQCRVCGAYYIGETKDLPPSLELPACRECGKKKDAYGSPALRLRHSLLEMETVFDKENLVAIAQTKSDLKDQYEEKDFWDTLKPYIPLALTVVCLTIFFYFAWSGSEPWARAAIAQAESSRYAAEVANNATKLLAEVYQVAGHATPSINPT